MDEFRKAVENLYKGTEGNKFTSKEGLIIEQSYATLLQFFDAVEKERQKRADIEKTEQNKSKKEKVGDK